MNAEFTELNYMFGAIKEILETNKWGKNVIPYFPSQQEEATTGCDVYFDKGIPVFLQFKTSRKMTRFNAKEWSFFNVPYYKFFVYPNSKTHQHNLLVKLGKNKFNNVFLCCTYVY